jgi:hypothetical protein
MAELRAKKLSAAKVIATETGHGFIAPPTLVDINKDGYIDIIVITHGSKAIAIDGKDQHVLWSRTFPGTECSNSFAPGYFTDDDVPDFFTFISKGEWPNSSGTLAMRAFRVVTQVFTSTGANTYTPTAGMLYCIVEVLGGGGGSGGTPAAAAGNHFCGMDCLPSLVILTHLDCSLAGQPQSLRQQQMRHGA